MDALRAHLPLALLPLLAVATACASAGDRLNEGIELQAQGRYMAAVERYAEALEKDPTLREAQDRILAAGESALLQAMDEADALEGRGDAVGAADRYRAVDRMLGRIRSVGLRLPTPDDYDDLRRAAFDRAIESLMARGYEAEREGRWPVARRAFRSARRDYLPTRTQVEESLDAETRLMLTWADVELQDGRPRAAFARARDATQIRRSPSRDVVLQARSVQERALDLGTVVVAALPVTASRGVRDLLGPEFEIRLDEVLTRQHWTLPPLFVEMADPLLLRRELRGLLRGRVPRSPLVVGRALELIGADLGVTIEVSAIEVAEEDVERESREARVVARRDGAIRRGVDTVTYHVESGTLAYHVEAVGILVDVDGRVVTSFTAAARERGPFRRGVYEGDPSTLDLDADEDRLFSPDARATQRARIEAALMEELAAAVAAGTYDTVLAGVP